MDFERFDPFGRTWQLGAESEEPTASRCDEPLIEISALKDRVECSGRQASTIQDDLISLGIDLQDMKQTLGAMETEGGIDEFMSGVRGRMKSNALHRMSLDDAVGELASDIDGIGADFLRGVGDQHVAKTAAQNDADFAMEDEEMKQPNSWTCAPAVTNYILEAFGVDGPGFEELAEDMKASPENGVDPEVISSILSSYVDQYQVDGMNGLIDALNKGDPVIMAMTQEDGTGHFIVLEDFGDEPDVFTGFCPLEGEISLTEPEVQEQWTMNTATGEAIQWGLAISGSKDDEDKSAMYMESIAVTAKDGPVIAFVSSLEEARKVASDDSLFNPGETYLITESRIKVKNGHLKGGTIMEQSMYDPSTDTFRPFLEAHKEVPVKRARTEAPASDDWGFLTPATKVTPMRPLGKKIALSEATKFDGGQFRELEPGIFQFKSAHKVYKQADDSLWEMMSGPDSFQLVLIEDMPTQISMDAGVPDRVEELRMSVQSWNEDKKDIEASVQSLVHSVTELVTEAESMGFQAMSKDMMKVDMGVDASPVKSGLVPEQVNVSQGPGTSTYGN